jgi:hypothetical protein
MAGRLTHLHWNSMLPDGLDVACCLASPALQSKLSKLHRLELGTSTLDDAGMCILLKSFPALTYIAVGRCQLQHSHVDELGCSRWDEVRVSSSDFASLARLPLRGIKRVRVWRVGTAGSSSTTTTATNGDAAGVSTAASLAAALAAAPDCTFAARWAGDYLALELHVSEMPALLPLIARWQGVGRLSLRAPAHGTNPQRLTPAAVKALGALLESMTSCNELSIAGMKPHPSAQLLPVLARTSVTRVSLVDYIITEAELMAWCAGGDAARPIVVAVNATGRFEGQPANVGGLADVPDSGVQLVLL